MILNVFSTFAVGGPQMRFATLANHFGSAYRHALVAMDGRLDCVERLSPDLHLAYPALAIRKGATLANAWQFRRLLRDLRPDVLVTSNWGSIEWAMANLWPLTRHIHIEDGFGPEESVGQIPRRVLTRRLVLRRSTVVLPSATLLRLATDIWRLAPSRLRHIPNGLDLRRFRPDGPADRLAVPGSAPLVGTVATLRPEKNLSRLLRAVALLLREGTALRLAIIGEGPERPRLQALAVELGIGGSVVFAGHVPDPAAAYRGLDLFALTSDTEQMPFSVLEAMASGLAVAATDVGDVRDMLAAQNLPYLCAKDDAAVAAALRPLLHDTALRARLGAANRAKAVRDYDEQAMFRAYAALLDGNDGEWR